MRRLVFSIIMASGLMVVGSSGASAEPGPTVSAKATASKNVCKITDPLLSEISGIVATRSGFVVVNDGSDDEEYEKVFFLRSEGGTCTIDQKKSFSGKGPLDVEDMVLSADGKTLWIADTGDNSSVFSTETQARPSIALWSMTLTGADKPKLYRLVYPNGDHHDAEALLLNGDGTPIIVTREVGKPAGLYQPAAPLKAGSETGVPLKRVGELNVVATETAGNPVARIGNRTISGGAVAPGGAKVALRTYTDALEWDVTGGDVLGALKKTPRVTALPNEPLGEALSYSADGKLFFTASDLEGDKKTAHYIRQYVPATEVAVVTKKSAGDAGDKSWYSDLTVSDVTYLVAGVGALGLILMGIGVFGIMRFRRRHADDPDEESGATGGIDKDEPETELIGVGSLPQRGAAYGGGGAGNRPGSAYGGQAGAPQYGRSGPSAAPPVRGAQQPPRNGQQPPVRGPQQPPARGPQQPPVRGPQQSPHNGQQPPRNGQQPSRNGQQPPRSGQQPSRNGQQPPRNGQQPPVRGPQQAPARGPQPTPGRAPQQQPPARAPQPPPVRGPQPPQRGGQPPARGPQPPPRGGQQPPRGGQQPPRGGQQPPPGRGANGYGGQPPARAPQPPPVRGPQQPGAYGGSQPPGRPQRPHDDRDDPRHGRR